MFLFLFARILFGVDNHNIENNSTRGYYKEHGVEELSHDANISQVLDVNSYPESHIEIEQSKPECNGLCNYIKEKQTASNTMFINESTDHQVNIDELSVEDLMGNKHGVESSFSDSSSNGVTYQLDKNPSVSDNKVSFVKMICSLASLENTCLDFVESDVDNADMSGHFPELNSLDTNHIESVSLTSSGISSSMASNLSTEPYVPSSEFSSICTNGSAFSSSNVDQKCPSSSNASPKSNHGNDQVTEKLQIDNLNTYRSSSSEQGDTDQVSQTECDFYSSVDRATPENTNTTTIRIDKSNRDSKTPSPSTPPSPYTPNYPEIESFRRSLSTSPVDLGCDPDSSFSYYSAPTSLEWPTIANDLTNNRPSSSDEIRTEQIVQINRKYCTQCALRSRNKLTKSKTVTTPCRYCILQRSHSLQSSRSNCGFSPIVGTVKSGLNCTDLNYNKSDFDIPKTLHRNLTDSVISINVADSKVSEDGNKVMSFEDLSEASNKTSDWLSKMNNVTDKAHEAVNNISPETTEVFSTSRPFLSRLNFSPFNLPPKSTMKDEVDPSRIECVLKDGMFILRRNSKEINGKNDTLNVERDGSTVILCENKVPVEFVDEINQSDKRMSSNSVCSTISKDSDYCSSSSVLTSPTFDSSATDSSKFINVNSIDQKTPSSLTNPVAHPRTILKSIPELPKTDDPTACSKVSKFEDKGPSAPLFASSCSYTKSVKPTSFIFLDTLNIEPGTFQVFARNTFWLLLLSLLYNCTSAPKFWFRITVK